MNWQTPVVHDCGEEPPTEAEGAAPSGDNAGFEAWLQGHSITDVQGSKLPMYHKQDMREAYAAGELAGRSRCRYPECVENDEEQCQRWLTGECGGPKR